jgi:hypothetical protein
VVLSAKTGSAGTERTSVTSSAVPPCPDRQNTSSFRSVRFPASSSITLSDVLEVTWSSHSAVIFPIVSGATFSPPASGATLCAYPPESVAICGSGWPGRMSGSTTSFQGAGGVLDEHEVDRAEALAGGRSGSAAAEGEPVSQGAVWA